MAFLEGKVAVVTGASSGIGLAISTALARQGCELALASRRINEEKDFPDMLMRSCDVRDPSAVDTFFAAVRERFGHIDILVNNAGNSHRLLNVDEMPVET